MQHIIQNRHTIKCTVIFKETQLVSQKAFIEHENMEAIKIKPPHALTLPSIAQLTVSSTCPIFPNIYEILQRGSFFSKRAPGPAIKLEKADKKGIRCTHRCTTRSVIKRSKLWGKKLGSLQKMCQRTGRMHRAKF